MKIATWNVNSVRARLENVLAWAQSSRSDVILLQEIKCEGHHFPAESFQDYNAVVHGQKSYNGVAILSRYPLEDVREGLPGLPDDPQARYIEALVNGPKGVVRVASVYVPNGQSVGSDKFHYKMKFLEAFHQHLKDLLKYDESVVIGGDYNIAPTDDDVADPKGWHEEILCSTSERLALQSVFHLGYYDALRLQHAGPGPFTWWDYRSGSWDRNDGLRIDHLLLSPQAADQLATSGVDRDERGRDKASDHAPVWCELKEREGLWHSQLTTSPVLPGSLG